LVASASNKPLGRLIAIEGIDGSGKRTQLDLLAAALTPALQGIVSKAVDPQHQGITLGSLNSISSIMGVIAPLIGTPVLAQVSGLPPTDWRVGATFFGAATAQGVALLQAYLHFRKTRFVLSAMEPA
jgi:hypothetical protein